MIRTFGKNSDFKPWYAKAEKVFIVQWDKVPMKNRDPETGEETDTDMSTWMQEIFYHVPTENELKRMMADRYNWETDHKILSGFTWRNMPIWLSEENQRNYASIYNLAYQGKPVLPSTFKFGTDENPEYFTFESFNDLEDFYLNAVKYIESCYTEGWTKKDAIDMSLYADLINKK